MYSNIPSLIAKVIARTMRFLNFPDLFCIFPFRGENEKLNLKSEIYMNILITFYVNILITFYVNILVTFYVNILVTFLLYCA